MKNKFISAISSYINNSDDGKFDFIKGQGYEQPLFGFASVNDNLFIEYKKIISEKHLTPMQAFENKFGYKISDGTVISVLLPFNESVIASNRLQKTLPSVEWTLARTYIDEIFQKKIVQFAIQTLNDMGYKAVNPVQEKDFQIFRDPHLQVASTWSQRHIAYAAGLGTFSINDAMITEKGIAVRFISIVTDLIIEPSERKYKTHTSNCIFCSTGKCGICMKRCPAAAITPSGHDKLKCYEYCYGARAKELARERGADEKYGSGCGLCLTGVPCERQNPSNCKISNTY
ncbi:MAG: (Fe-S)-binding protein [Elusimicrobiota bacterium]|jgi:epoxyqueuosine reductase QueG|nr:(Fe-S)-binding protein [Elusimicrobiota bacterium]